MIRVALWMPVSKLLGSTVMTGPGLSDIPASVFQICLAAASMCPIVPG